jgi:hypothetical protein
VKKRLNREALKRISSLHVGAPTAGGPAEASGRAAVMALLGEDPASSLSLQSYVVCSRVCYLYLHLYLYL